MKGRVIDEEAVCLLAVFPQALAVVAGQNDQGIPQEALLPQESEHSTDLGVRKGDFTVIGMTEIPTGIGLRRLVGCVRVVEVNPQKEWPPGVELEPPESRVHHSIPTALNRVQMHFI